MLGQRSISSGAVMYILCCMRRKSDPCLFVQIDLRYTNPEEGSLEVVVAPVMRFKDIEFNANVKIEEIAPPERIISGFALEIFGAPLQVCLYLSLSWFQAKAEEGWKYLCAINIHVWAAISVVRKQMHDQKGNRLLRQLILRTGRRCTATRS